MAAEAAASWLIFPLGDSVLTSQLSHAEDSCFGRHPALATLPQLPSSQGPASPSCCFAGSTGPGLAPLLSSALSSSPLPFSYPTSVVTSAKLVSGDRIPSKECLPIPARENSPGFQSHEAGFQDVLGNCPNHNLFFKYSQYSSYRLLLWRSKKIYLLKKKQEVWRYLPRPAAERAPNNG